MEKGIILDAGHGGFDNGASYQGRTEKDDVLKLTKAVGERLSQLGYPIMYTRTEDVYQSPYQKAESANQSGADYFISFHRNYSMEDNLYRGVQALIYADNEEAKALGEAMNGELEQLGFRNIGIESIPNLIVLRETDMPAVLMEVGFINSEDDNRIFDEQFEEVVEAIVNGITETLPLSEAGGTPVAAFDIEDTMSFFVQTGLFKYDVNAAYQLERLRLLGYNGIIHYEKPYYGVWVEGGTDLESALDVQNRLRRQGYSTLIVADQKK